MNVYAQEETSRAQAILRFVGKGSGATDFMFVLSSASVARLFNEN